jgi:2'-5' RNA ligase
MTAPAADGTNGGGASRSIGVAIGLPEPFNSELQRWRERLGDPNAARIPPHVTLLPPTDVPSGTLPAIEKHLLNVAMNEQEFDLRLRGSATFRPVSPVVFVPLVQGISECERLEAKVRTGPLHRDLHFPYHPHVTVAHDLPADSLDGAFAALASYEADFRVHGFSLFEQDKDGTWRPQRDFVFGGGGLPGPEEAPPESRRREPGW